VGGGGRGGSALSADGPKGKTTIEEPTAAERTVARRAAESRATIPDLELSVELSAERAAATSQLVLACALALREHPRANASYRDGRFELHARINVGVVLATAESYLIPTIFDADRKSLAELEAEVEQLRAQAAEGTLAPPAFSGATFTAWNAAELGIDWASIPVVGPQAASLTGGGRALTLVCDHRILYGAAAAAFLNDVRKRLLQTPAGQG
jgi:pyruvate dehydrogenase E2 component (dihydrolipoamide acetyltransferase)